MEVRHEPVRSDAGYQTMNARYRNLLACLLAASTAMPVAGQYYVQQGNALDASNLVGSGGINDARIRPQYNLGNNIVSGTSRGGTAFRGFSPVRDASSLFLGTAGQGGSAGAGAVPSSGMSTFIRDSVSMGDARRSRTRAAPLGGFMGGSIGPRGSELYFPRESTVTSLGAMRQGLNQPGSSQVRSEFIAPRAESRARLTNPLAQQDTNLLQSPLQLSSRLVRADTGREITGPVNPRLLSSPLFGAFRAVPMTEVADQAQRDRGLTTGLRQPEDLRAQPAGPADLRAGGALDLRTWTPDGLSPLDRLLGGQPAPPVPDGAPPPGVVGAQGQVSGDAFAELQGRLLRPTIPLPDEQMTGPGAAEPAGVAAPQGPAGMLAAAGEQPLRTFVGTERSAVNGYLAQAEEQLKSGQYYGAATAYGMAHAIDPRNPLPLIGRAMALLAAGDYVSSVTDLFQGIAVFESLAMVRIDLTAFVPDLKILDRRRADLERRLANFDDYRLRFLLGFAEYSSGLIDAGTANIRKAAESLPEGMDAVRRFAAALGSSRSQVGPAAPATRPQ